MRRKGSWLFRAVRHDRGQINVAKRDNPDQNALRNRAMTKPTSVFGLTRTHLGARHALIGPDGHVPSFLPGVEKATTIVLISKEMGARFTQLLLTFTVGGGATFRE